MSLSPQAQVAAWSWAELLAPRGTSSVRRIKKPKPRWLTPPPAIRTGGGEAVAVVELLGELEGDRLHHRRLHRVRRVHHVLHLLRLLHAIPAHRKKGVVGK